jgi:HEAT repeat protein
MRRSAPTPDNHRSLLAGLADEDIWVAAEAILTLGTLFGDEPEAHAQLYKALSASHPICRVAAAEALGSHAQARDWRALSQMARKDAQPEARRAAVLAFTRSTESRTAISVARAALKDDAWPVRRAGVEVLASLREPSAIKLLLDAAAEMGEEPAVRGAALRALAKRDVPETIELACQAINAADATLIEDAYAALYLLRRTRRALLRKTLKTCPPRAASVIAFILNGEDASDS